MKIVSCTQVHGRVAVIAVMLLAGAAWGQSPGAADTAGAAATKAQTTCPVMGGAVNRALFVDVEGKRIYVCCAGCIEAIRKDPAKYIRKLEADGVTLEAAPAATNTAAAAASPAR